MGLGLGFSLSQRCTIGHRLKTTQKIGLKLLLEQKLNHPEYPNMLKGFDGMKIAHKILQEKNARGVLIGGLSEAIWNYNRKPEDLITHKDIDIAVLDKDFTLNAPFENGIDWWLPKTEQIKFKSEYSNKKLAQTWYENGAECILSFGMKIRDYANDLPSGLYLPDSDWVIDMRRFEASAHIDYNNLTDIEIDDDVFEKFEKEKRKTIKNKVPKFISKEFGENILTSEHQKDSRLRTAIQLEEFTLETLRAINYFKDKN